MDQGHSNRSGAGRHPGVRSIRSSRRIVGLPPTHAAHAEREEFVPGTAVAASLERTSSLYSTIAVKGRKLFYSGDQINTALPAGLTLDEMLIAVEWPDALRPYTLAYIGGVEILPEHWKRVRPRVGHQVFFGVRPAGGKGGTKKILSVVAAIAIMVVAWYAAPALVAALGGTAYAGAAAGAYATVAAGTALSTTSMLVAGGLSMVGTLALGALVKPPTAEATGLGATASLGSNIGSSASSGGEAKSYGLTIAANVAKPYSPVPRVLGRHRVSPALAAESFVVSEGGLQTAYMLLDFGVGPLHLEDLRVGTTSISQFPGIRFLWHPQFRKGDPLSFYSGDHAVLKVDSSIERNQEIVRKVPQSCEQAHVEIVAPGGLVAVDATGARVNTQYRLEIFYAEDGQPWTPLRWADGGILFRGDAGVGANGFTQVTFLGMVSHDTSARKFRMAAPQTIPVIGMSLLFSDGNYYRIADVTPVGPDGENADGKPWWQFQHYLIGTDGSPATTTIKFATDSAAMISMFNTLPTPAIAGTWNVYPRYDLTDASVMFDGRTTSAQAATITLNLPYRANWNIRVVGHTEAFAGNESINQLKWNGLRATRRGDTVIPSSARSLMEVTFSASENINGQISAFNALVTSVVQLWDGNFYPTRNPAHLVWEVLTGPAAVKQVPWGEINSDKLFTWAQWCDEVSAQGDRRCTTDMIVDTRTTVGQLCTLIASCGRAAVTVIDGKYDVLMEDEVRTPVQLFTERNTTGSAATRTWVDQPHAVKVSYIDENTWERAETYVYADGHDALTATRIETLNLVGVTRGFQAWRDGRYYMAASNLRREVVEFQTDIENIVCARGDLVLYSHDLFYGAITSRVQAWSDDGWVQVDSIFDMTDYSLAQWRRSDGSITELAVQVFPPDMLFANAWLPKTHATGGEPNTATVGTPGSQPTGWYMQTPGSGMLRAILGTGVAPGGLPYFDIQTYGTQTAGRSMAFHPFLGANGGIAATIGETVHLELFFQDIGPEPGDPTVQCVLREYDSGGVILTGNNIQEFTAQRGGELATAKYSRSYTVQSPACIRVSIFIQYQPPLNTPFDYRYRCGPYIIYKTNTVRDRPEVSDLITIGQTETAVEEWLVDAVTPSTDLSAKIRLIEHAPAILLADRGPIPPYVPPGGTGYTGSMAPPTNLEISAQEVFLDGRPIYQARASWLPPVGVAVSRYEVYDGVVFLGAVAQPPFDFVVDRLSLPRPQGEERSYTVQAVSVRGRRSASTAVVRLWVPDTAPPVLTLFSANVVDSQILLFWGTDGSPDLERYQIRYSPDLMERVWERMTVVVESLSGQAATASILRRTGAYGLRAVDTGGNWSAPLFTNVIITYPEIVNFYSNSVGQTAWAGVYDRVQNDAGVLVLAPGETEGWWYANDSIFETNTWRFRLTTLIQAAAADSLVPDDWNAEIWVSAEGSSPVLSSAWFTPLANASPLAGVAGQYYSSRALQSADIDASIVRWAVRMTRKTTNVNPRVTKAELLLDLVERTEFGSNVVIPSAGLRINFVFPYYRDPSIGIAIEGTDRVNHFTKTSDLTGFFIQAFDNNTPVSCTIDWNAIGYGRQYV